MTNATSNFLQGANAANAAAGSAAPSSSAPVDTARVLAAISSPEVSDMRTLANALDVTPSNVSPTIDRLSRDGLVIKSDDEKLELSESGERALRYTELSSLA